jgi:hypothetical protein
MRQTASIVAQHPDAGAMTVKMIRNAILPQITWGRMKCLSFSWFERLLWADAVEKGLRDGLNDGSCSLDESGKIRR